MDDKAALAYDKLNRITSGPPTEMVEELLGGGKRWDTQRAILDSVWANPRTLVASGHGLGKTFTMADVVIAFMLAFRPAKVITSAPTWRQVESLLWSEINAKYKASRYNLGGRLLDTRWDIMDDWFAVGFSPDVRKDEGDRGTKMAGYHGPHVLVALDEAPGVDPMLWEAVDGLLTGAHARFLGIGNPVSASGPFYNEWASGRVTKIHMSCFDSPNFVANKVTSLEELQKRAQRMDEAELMALKAPYPALSTVAWAAMMLKKWGPESVVFASRVLGTFPDQANDTLVPLAWLDKCAHMDLPGRKHTMSGKSLGVDVARFGSNMTVFQGFDGWKHVLREVRSGWDTQRTAGRIIQALRDEDYRVVAIDVDGLGAGVYDAVCAWNRGQGGKRYVILPVHNGAKPENTEQFLNVRAESYWNTRELIKDGKVEVKDEGDLFHQLTAIKYRINSKGQIELETKEQMSRRGLQSPDEADAFVLGLMAARVNAPGASSAAGWIERMASEGADRDTASAPWRI